MTLQPTRIQVCVREEHGDTWQQRSKVNVSTSHRAVLRSMGKRRALWSRLGCFPEKKSTRRCEQDNTRHEELTRRILDRVFFPKLAE